MHATQYIHTHIITEASLTVDNLSIVFDSVSDIDFIMRSGWLQIPDSKQHELKQQYGYDGRLVKKAFAECFLTQHPGPSWRIVALALWHTGQLGALEIVQKLYLKGEPCAYSCIRDGEL